jgi:hypothetical protein
MRMQQVLRQEPVQHQTIVKLYAPEVSFEPRRPGICIEESCVRITLLFESDGALAYFINRIISQHRDAA